MSPPVSDHFTDITEWKLDNNMLYLTNYVAFLGSARDKNFSMWSTRVFPKLDFSHE